MLRLALGVFLLVLPVVELTLLIKTGQLVGLWATLGLLVGAGVIGGLILSRQSMTVLRETQIALVEGRPPVGPALDGAFLMLAGILLMIPGFFSDALALLLLIPPLRRAIAGWCLRRLADRAEVHVSGVRTTIEGQPANDPGAPGRAEGMVIEGEFERLGERPAESQRGPDRDRR